MVLLELAYLHEIGRTTGPGEEAIDFLRSSIGLVVADDPFDQVATAATKLSFTRDPFDRIITAQASLRRRRLVTADQSIRENYRHSVW